MKKTVLTLVLLLGTVLCFAQSGKMIYQKYSDEKGIEAVYISPSMFKMIGKLPKMDVGKEDIDISSIVSSLEGMYILECENRSIKDKLAADVKGLVASKKFELLMEAKDGDEVMKLYAEEKNGEIVSLVMLELEPDEVAFICFEGKLSKANLETLIKSAK